MTGIFDWYRKPVEERENDVVEARKHELKKWADMLVTDYRLHGRNTKIGVNPND
jgi:hypothetical protein